MDSNIAKYRKEYKDFEFGDENYVEFLDDNNELSEIAYIFNLRNWEYSGDNLIGKNYDQLKDLLKWNGFNLKKTIPTILQMSRIYRYEVNNRKGK